MPTVSAIIPSWNRADLVRQVLHNLHQQSRLPDEILVVDNGSSDDSAAAAAESGATVISLKQNLGFAGAVNEGIARASGDWLLILNNDVLLEPRWLEILLATATESKASFAAGKLLQSDNTSLLDGSWDLVSRAGHAWRCGYNRPDGSVWSKTRVVPMVPMTAALFQRALFNKVGTLDTRFEAYYEDIDFGVRCGLARKTGIYEPAAVAVHQGKGTLGKRSARLTFLTARNQLWVLAKHCPDSYFRKHWWPVLVGQTLGLIGAAQHGHFVSDLKGKGAALGRWKEFRGHVAAPADAEALFAYGENQIRELQTLNGFDPYWRLYFRLVPKPRKEPDRK